jgi:protein SCO1/2
MNESLTVWDRRWLLKAGAVVAPVLLLAGALAFAPKGAWLSSFETVHFRGRDVGLQDWHGAFSLLDTSGKRRTLRDFGGKVVLLAFGYTRCPDACPTTLLRLAKARQLLEEDADKVQVLFVTIDPERDGAQMLESYVHTFDPTFVGLRGNEAETDAATDAFHADYRIMQHGKDVLVEHTVDTYLIDPVGRVRVVLPYSLSAEDVANDVHTVLRDSGLCWPWSRNEASTPGRSPTRAS